MKANPILHEQYLLKERLRYQERKARKQPLTNRELRKKRKKQRINTRNFRLKRNAQLSIPNDNNSEDNILISEEVEEVVELPEERACTKTVKAKSIYRRRKCYKNNTELRKEIQDLKVSISTKQKKITRLNNQLQKAINPPLSTISTIKDSLKKSNLPKDLQTRLVNMNINI